VSVPVHRASTFLAGACAPSESRVAKRLDDTRECSCARQCAAIVFSEGPKSNSPRAIVEQPASKMNPVDNDNVLDTRQSRRRSKMRNKTPWLWQNFLEGLEEEALPEVSSRKAKPRVSRKQQERSRRKASLADERLPDPQPLLDSDDSLENFRKPNRMLQKERWRCYTRMVMELRHLHNNNKTTTLSSTVPNRSNVYKNRFHQWQFQCQSGK
jgi:hypothetical protein